MLVTWLRVHPESGAACLRLRWICCIWQRFQWNVWNTNFEAAMAVPHAKDYFIGVFYQLQPLQLITCYSLLAADGAAMMLIVLTTRQMTKVSQKYICHMIRAVQWFINSYDSARGTITMGLMGNILPESYIGIQLYWCMLHYMIHNPYNEKLWHYSHLQKFMIWHYL